MTSVAPSGGRTAAESPAASRTATDSRGDDPADASSAAPVPGPVRCGRMDTVPARCATTPRRATANATRTHPAALRRARRGARRAAGVEPERLRARSSAWGIRPGERVAMMMSNVARVPRRAGSAILRAGGDRGPGALRLPRPAARAHPAPSPARASSSATRSSCHAWRRSTLPALERVVVRGARAEGWRRPASRRHASTRPLPLTDAGAELPSTPRTVTSCILYTSGTTGPVEGRRADPRREPRGSRRRTSRSWSTGPTTSSTRRSRCSTSTRSSPRSRRPMITGARLVLDERFSASRLLGRRCATRASRRSTTWARC